MSLSQFLLEHGGNILGAFALGWGPFALMTHFKKLSEKL